MSWPVTIYSNDDETLIGEGTLEGFLREAAGQHHALLRPPPGLEAGAYVLRFEDGQRWPVETLSKPGRRWFNFGGRVTAVSHQAPPTLTLGSFALPSR